MNDMIARQSGVRHCYFKILMQSQLLQMLVLLVFT